MFNLKTTYDVSKTLQVQHDLRSALLLRGPQAKVFSLQALKIKLLVFKNDMIRLCLSWVFLYFTYCKFGGFTTNFRQPQYIHTKSIQSSLVRK